jgi:hypothetical protein
MGKLTQSEIIAIVIVSVIFFIVVVVVIVAISIPKHKLNHKYTSTSVIFGCDKSLPCCTINDVFDENPTCNVCC